MKIQIQKRAIKFDCFSYFRCQKKSRMRFTLLLLLAMSLPNALAQDPIFSQAYANRLYLNPALTGVENNPLVYAQYRNQWPALSANFVTTTVAYDQKIKSINSGIGFIAMHDAAGRTLTQTSLGVNYSYEMVVGDSIRISTGTQVLLGYKQVDWDKMTFGDMIDPRQGFIFQTGDVIKSRNRTFLDLAAGVAVQWHGLFLGGAVHHINRPDVSMVLGESILPMRYTLHLGYNFRIPFIENNQFLTITPHVMYQKQSQFDMLVVGGYLNYRNITLGCFSRSRDAVIGLMGYDFKFGRVAYSYDYTMSMLTNISGGSHELSLSWRLGVNRQTKLSRANEFPQF
jgi:type IX secretion system PorP/SprF family membrane protein